MKPGHTRGDISFNAFIINKTKDCQWESLVLKDIVLVCRSHPSQIYHWEHDTSTNSLVSCVRFMTRVILMESHLGNNDKNMQKENEN